MDDFKCKDGGMCGLGGTCPDCPQTTSASASNGLLCCPKCGGDTGFIEKKIMKYDQWREWDGTAIDAIDKESRGGKLKYCADCGKNVTSFVNEMKEEE
jgi:hypothetical protein